MIKPTIGYHWESHLDASLGNGFSRHVPIPWLITALGLRPDIENVGVYADSQGLPIIVSGRDDRHSYILVRRDALLAMARRNEVEPVWTVIGERSARTEGNNRTSDVRVRYNGSLWLDADIAVLRHWSRSD